MKYEYKVGDEVLVRVQIVKDDVCVYGLKTPDGILFNSRKECVLPVQTMTAEEAWEIAEKISEMNDLDILEYILEGDAIHPIQAVFYNLTPQEAKAKIKAWKANQINLGDEVVLKSCLENDECKFFVTHIDKEENEISGFSGFNGDVFCERKMRLYKKTGRHIDITKILKQSGGDE